MTAPYLSPRLHLLVDAPASPFAVSGPQPHAPLVPTLEVRLGSGRPRRYALHEAKLTIGGPGCDIVLPESTVPPLVAEMTSLSGGTEFELTHVEPTFPVLVNGRQLVGGRPVLLKHGDRLAVGAVDLTIQDPTIHLHPEMALPPPEHPARRSHSSGPDGSFERSPAATPPTYGPDVVAQRAALAKERDELARQRAEVAAAAEELEADRVLWYRRRSEMAQESNTAAALGEREAGLHHFQAELEKSRQDLAEQFRLRKEQLTRMQEALDGSAAALTVQRRQFEDDAVRRSAEAESELRRRRDELEAEAERQRLHFTTLETDSIRHNLIPSQSDPAAARLERDRFTEELLRLERRQTLLDDHERAVAARELEAERLREECLRREAELEELQAAAAADQAQFLHRRDEWERTRSESAEREATLAERERAVESRQAKLVVLRAGLERQQEELRQGHAGLASDRLKLDEARKTIDDRLREAEALRVEFASLKDDRGEQTRIAHERAAALEAALAETKTQREAVEAERLTLLDRAAELDTRTAALAEQTAELQARANQFAALQKQHEAEKTTLAQRLVHLTESDAARQNFQEQLRRRSDELTARAKALDESAKHHTKEQSALEQLRAELDAERERLRAGLTGEEVELRKLIGDVESKTASVVERETNLDRQALRLREVGKLVAEEKRKLAESRLADEQSRAEHQTFHTRSMQEIAALKSEAPHLFDQVKSAMERLDSARTVLGTRLGELHGFAGQTRSDLDDLRAELRHDAAKLDDRERAFEQARAEHRLAVVEFRSQVLEWQDKLAAFEQSTVRDADRLQVREAEVDETTMRLARRAEELDAEKSRVAERRSEVEMHLSDMREWYRRKLKELAVSRPANAPRNVLPLTARAAGEEPDPGDKHLGEALKRLELVDPETLETLWGEARRQRRPLRQVLLAGGAVTLYQLAMIETGQVSALMLGHLRVIDRPRVTPRESVFRVLDPSRLDWSTKGLFLLRHLSEAEMDDAVRPDEFRQQFAAAREAAHPNLAAVVDVLEIQNRPAALLEWLVSLPSSEWPAEAGIPGLWVRLLCDAAKGLDAAHRHGLVHGRLSSDSFVLTSAGDLKLLGIGEPWWLATGVSPTGDPSVEADLRALGQVAYGWSRLGRPAGVRRSRVLPFPESLSAVIRRLEADPETPMADTAVGAMPYRSAAELVNDLNRLAAIIPVPPEARAELLRKLVDGLEQAPARQSA